MGQITEAVLGAVEGMRELIASLVKSFRAALSRARYHPEKHYMRQR